MGPFFLIIAGDGGRISLLPCGRQQNARDFVRTFDMTVVAGLYFGDLPAGSTGFCGKRREGWFCRISVRNTTNEGGGDAGLPIGGKRKRLLKAAQTEITQPGTDEITRGAWLQSPEIKLTFATRQPPTLAMLLRDAAEMGADGRWKQVQYTLPVFWNEGIQEN